MPALHDQLDHNGFLPIQIATGDDTTTIEIDLSRSSNTRFTQHFLDAILLKYGQHTISFTQKDNRLYTTVNPAANKSLIITLNDRNIAVYHCSDKKITADVTNVPNRLTVFETRMLGRYPHRHTLPYNRDGAESLDNIATPITDLHTHLSSQIPVKELVAVAANCQAPYPLELLQLIGVNTAKYTPLKVSMPSYEFTPTQSEGLACEQRDKQVDGVAIHHLSQDDQDTLMDALAIPSDTIYTFEALEKNVYRVSNPLTKNPDVIAKSIVTVAETYQKQGIQYAELAVTGALKPDWLAKAIPALEEAEATHGVQLRLLAGIPRTLPPHLMLQKIEMAKYAAQSPYVVGVDFIGYESNKTENFSWALDHIANWAHRQKTGHSSLYQPWDFPDDFIVRVHAGENGKNMNNVRAVLEIAYEYGIRTRIGHGIYVNHDDTLDLAKQLAENNKLIIEFNPDSNIALNNIDNATQLPIKFWVDTGIPSVLASDGGGAYQTDATQLAMAGTFAGLQQADLVKINQWERQHIDYQHTLFEEKSQAFAEKYPSVAHFIEGFKAHEQSTRRAKWLAHKTPILIAGASGSSWERMHPAEQQEFRIGMELLVQLLDPAKTYFAMGRVKNAGIGKILDKAVTQYNKQHLDSTPFDVVGLLNNQQNMPTIANCLSHIIPVSGPLMGIPNAMVQFVKDHQGHALYVGGSDFTRDFILQSEKLDIPFAVMENATGASKDAATLMKESGSECEHRVFQGAVEMILTLANQQQGRRLFRDDAALERKALAQRYEAIERLLDKS